MSGRLDRLIYLSAGLSLILLFIGMKLIHLPKRDDSIPEVSIVLSLTVIVAILAAGTVASLVKASRDPSARAHAGSLRGNPPAEAAEP